MFEKSWYSVEIQYPVPPRYDGFVPDSTKPLAESVLTYHKNVLWHLPDSKFTLNAYELTIRYDKYDAMRGDTIQHNTTQHNAIQYI